MTELYAVILAGGSGTRFWPASRRLQPKQLLPIAPGSTRSLIAETVRRLEPLCAREAILVATGSHLLDATRAALPQLPDSSFLGEPLARNTAACIGWATSIIQRRSPDAVVMVLPSDQHIANELAFRQTLERAVDSARSGAITTIGIEPTRPETGYGYIEAGDAVAPGVERVVRFVEKPDRARAEQYLASGRYLWNSGMFFFRASGMRAAIERHMPALATGLRALDAASRGSAEHELAETARVFSELPSVSIDYGVMEKESELRVVRGNFGWSDLGSWQSAWELSPKDQAGNAGSPGAVFVDARNNLVSDSRKNAAEQTIALLGLEDVCVIATDDALLVMPKNRSEDVRLVVEALKERGHGNKL